jgi:protein-tyrosine-phosphatase
MAEIIFSSICKQEKRKDITVKSAGTSAEVGSDMTKEAKIALIDNGFKMPKKRHRATQFTDDMFKEFDHIICLNNGLFDKNVRQLYIEDPYQRGLNAYYEVAMKLKEALNNLYQELFDK